jgi:hypothetical protein
MEIKMTQDGKKKTFGLAAFAFLALSAFAVSAPTVKAWGPWGAWAPASQLSTCSASAGNGTVLPCTGKGGVAGALLAAYSSGEPRAKTQAYAWPKLSNGQYFSVIADSVSSASATGPIGFSHSICRCYANVD